MNNRLPLYDTLAKQAPGKVDRSKLALLLESLSTEQATQVTLLLIHHYFRGSTTNPFTKESCNYKNRKINLPFNIIPSVAGKGFSFDLGSLPSDLVGILAAYCGM